MTCPARGPQGGPRLDQKTALGLFEEASLPALAGLAGEVRKRLHPRPFVTFCIDRNINYTNICATGCSFCAFRRRPGDGEGYVLGREELRKKLKELAEAGGTQVLLQGGHHPGLDLAWYEELLRFIRREFPAIHIHGFSPSEFAFFSRLWGRPVGELLGRFKEAGLHSIPGGGAEILVDRVRRILSPHKATAAEWLEVFRQASRLGLRGSCSMVIGHLETPAERIEHLEQLRRLQDETGGMEGVFTAFILWTMQPARTGLEGKIEPATPADYLRTAALARLYLDNIRNLQSSWVTQGPKVGQLGILFGCNDWGGLMMEENVVSGTGTRHQVSIGQMRRLSAELGLALRQRDFFYRCLDETPPP